MADSVYSYNFNSTSGSELPLENYKGRVILVVNTATGCGRVGQLEELENLYRQFRDSGFIVLGVPSNDFAQEPLNGKDIAEFCLVNYGVTFPMTQKTHVKGDEAHPLFKFFADKSRNGKIQRKPRWNFYKFLIGRDGKVVDSFWTYRRPSSRKIKSAIKSALSAKQV